MINTGTKSSDEIIQLVKLIKTNKGLNDLQAVSYLSGLFYSYLTDEQITQIFTIVGKD
jgi:hypothetical protein